MDLTGLYGKPFSLCSVLQGTQGRGTRWQVPATGPLVGASLWLDSSKLLMDPSETSLRCRHALKGSLQGQ